MPSGTGGVRRKKLNKSKVGKSTRKTKQKDKKVRVTGNPIIAENWDDSLTLAQNYRKLGLASKLSGPAGGVEKPLDEDDNTKKDDKDKKPRKLGSNEGRIIRDENGEVVKIEYKNEQEEDEGDEDEDEWTGFEEDKTEVVKQLEAYAKQGYTKPHHQSGREEDWVARLVEKHGDNYDAMFMDRKLNIWQQSVGDLKRRVYKWKKKQGLA